MLNKFILELMLKNYQVEKIFQKSWDLLSHYRHA
jgi:hypothetical protein